MSNSETEHTGTRARGTEDSDFQVDELIRMLRAFDSLRLMYSEMDLPVFDGESAEWLAFQRAYSDTAAHFTPEENYDRVTTQLRGAALEHVAPLAGDRAAGPDRIVKALETRFGQPYMILSQQLDKVNELPYLHDQSLPKEFLMFASKVQDVVFTLKAVGPEHLEDPCIAMKVLDRLTSHHKHGWYKYAANSTLECPVVVKISEFLAEQSGKVCRYTFSWVIPPWFSDAEERVPAALDPARSWPERLQHQMLWTEALRLLSRLPRLEAPAPVQQVLDFHKILDNVVGLVSVVDKWLLFNAHVFYTVLKRLNPYHLWRWFDYAAAHAADAEPELVTLREFLSGETVHVVLLAQTREAAAADAEPDRTSTATCLCRGGSHESPECGALRATDLPARLGHARQGGVCAQCLDAPPRKRRRRRRLGSKNGSPPTHDG